MTNQIKIISDINSFKLGTINWRPINGQGFNPRVNWFYLLDEEKERIRCFDESEASLVMSFLTNVTFGQFGQNTPCFTNIQTAECDNNKCEDEVADGVKQNRGTIPNLPNKIFPSDFGINSISAYSLTFNVIGYFY